MGKQYGVATLLDPWLRTYSFRSDEERCKAVAYLQRELWEKWKATSPSAPTHAAAEERKQHKKKNKGFILGGQSCPFGGTVFPGGCGGVSTELLEQGVFMDFETRTSECIQQSVNLRYVTPRGLAV